MFRHLVPVAVGRTRSIAANGRVSFIQWAAAAATEAVEATAETAEIVWMHAHAEPGGAALEQPDPESRRPRGVIELGMSAQSRRNLQRQGSQLLAGALSKGLRPVFAVLTHGKDLFSGRSGWRGEDEALLTAAQTHKRDVDALRKRAQRAYGARTFACLRQREWQGRGAKGIHDNQLWFLPEQHAAGFESWLGSAWLDVTGLEGSSDAARRQRAVLVREPSHEDVMRVLGYLVSKEMGKSRQMRVPDSEVRPGRAWTMFPTAFAREIQALAPVQTEEHPVNIVNRVVATADAEMRPHAGSFLPDEAVVRSRHSMTGPKAHAAVQVIRSESLKQPDYRPVWGPDDDGSHIGYRWTGTELVRRPEPPSGRESSLDTEFRRVRQRRKENQ